MKTKIFCFNQHCVGQDTCAFDCVFQLANIARPVMCTQCCQGIITQSSFTATKLFTKVGGEMFGQQNNVTSAIPKRWDLKRKHCQKEKEVASKGTILHVSLQITIRR